MIADAIYKVKVRCKNCSYCGLFDSYLDENMKKKYFE